VSCDSIVDGNWLPATKLCHHYLLYDMTCMSRKIWEVSCTECTGQGNNFESIPMIKMKTRHPVEGSFESEFPATCNHCGVMAD